MIWWILGGILLLGAGFIAYVLIKFAMHEKHVRANGRPIVGMLAMANQSLYDPDGDPELPGFVVIGFQPPSPEHLERLGEVGHRVHELYVDTDTSTLSPAEQEFSASMKQHNHTMGRRRLIPEEITNGETYYVADIWLYRDRLLDGWEEHRAIACLVTGRDEGHVLHIGTDEDEAKSLYQAVGVV